MLQRLGDLRAAGVVSAVTGTLLLVVLLLATWQFAALRGSLYEQFALSSALSAQSDQLLQMVNEETGVRGYVATNDVQFLDVYYSSLTQWTRDAALLEKIPAARAALRAAGGDHVAARVQDYFEQQIALMQAGAYQVSRKNLANGKALFDALRRRETNAQATLQRDLSRRRHHTLFIVQVGLIASSVLAVLLAWWWAAFTVVLYRARHVQISNLLDPLTGAQNRRAAMATIERRTQTGAPFGIVFIDLDGFKKINDVYGHAAGDAILQTVATRLKAELREDDHVCRMGGDEFVCIISSMATKDHIRGVAARLRKSIAAPYAFGDDHYVVGCSVGISVYPEHGESPEQLLERADRAMYGAKAAGGGVREAMAG